MRRTATPGRAPSASPRHQRGITRGARYQRFAAAALTLGLALGVTVTATAVVTGANRRPTVLVTSAQAGIVLRKPARVTSESAERQAWRDARTARSRPASPAPLTLAPGPQASTSPQTPVTTATPPTATTTPATTPRTTTAAPATTTPPAPPPPPAPAPTTTVAAPPAPPASSGGVVVEILSITNSERATAGCGPLVLNDILNSVATAHAADMQANGYFAHNSQDGRSPFDRMSAAGYSFGTAGENIARGQQDATAVMSAWMNSSGHRANILNCAFTELGVGYIEGSGGPWWVQDFGG